MNFSTTCIFFVLLAGVFIGRNFSDSYISIRTDGTAPSASTPDEQPVSDGRIDINSASLQQLQLLPGIGETLAQRILDYREEHGSFSSVDDLLNVSGIGEKKLEQIRPYAKVVKNDENIGS